MSEHYRGQGDWPLAGLLTFIVLAAIVTMLLLSSCGCPDSGCPVQDSDVRETPDESIEPMPDAWEQPQYDHHELRREP